MKSNSNQALLGIILLLLGLIAYFTDSIHFNYSGAMLIFSGFAFILLYRTKRKSWSLIVGVYMVYAAILILLKNFSAINLSSLFNAMFFIVPGIIFLILFFDKNKRGLLIPANILLWAGIYVALMNFLPFETLIRAMVYFCVSGAFFCVCFMGRDFIGRWALYLGFVFAVLGVLRLLSLPFDLSKYFALLSMAAGLILIVRARRQNIS